MIYVFYFSLVFFIHGADVLIVTKMAGTGTQEYLNDRRF